MFDPAFSLQGNLGTLVLTNIRLVWHSDLNELFNLSLPYLRLSSVRVRDSKFGKALVVETTSSSGGYVLGFRVDAPHGGSSQELLDSKVKEIRALKEAHGKCPDFGVHYTIVNGVKQKVDNAGDDAGLGRREANDDEEEVVQKEEDSDSFAAYFADLGGKQCDRDPVYDPDLGLAVERVKDGFTLESLWHVSHPAASIATE
jgi:Bardet-Biedl syndrome 5 protein